LVCEIGRGRDEEERSLEMTEVSREGDTLRFIYSFISPECTKATITVNKQ